MSDLWRSVRFHTVVATLGVIILIVLGGFLFSLRGYEIALIYLVFLCGCLGGITGTFVRVRHLPPDTASVIAPATNKVAIFQVYVSIAVAGVFGLVAYGLFVTRILQGALFPEFSGVDEPFTKVLDLFANAGPKTRLDAAKVLLWSYVAGFSEWFVPNIIDDLANAAARAAKSVTSGVAGADAEAKADDAR
jgi:hypothetical protein